MHVDVAIIGAGTAGLNARRAAQKAGKSALMIDPGPFGTTCARVGCMPSKLLIAAANKAHSARNTEKFGVSVEHVRVDGPRVLQRVQSERDRFVGFVNESIQTAIEQEELLVGRAHIVKPGELLVDDQTTVTYDSLVIATGTSPFVPPPFREVTQHMMTNEHIFEMEDLPESLLVIGLGVIGLELGQAMHRLGVRTTLLGVRGVIGPISDPDVRALATEEFSKELDLHPNYILHAVTEDETGVHITFTDDHGNKRSEHFQKVLMAAGRRTTLPYLGLDNLGITPNAQGEYAIDPQTLQLEDQPIFVAGDVNQFHPLLHEAADDGRFAGANAANYPDVQSFERRISLGVVFSNPQIGIVGQNWAALQEQDIAIGQVSYHNQGRARVDGVNQGMVRIYGERTTGKLLGAELFGPSVEHLSHLLAWAIGQEMTVHTALSMPFYHPVVEEGIRTALQSLLHNLES